MGTVNLTLPTSGTEITAGLHAANYAAIQAALNGDIDAANIEDNAVTTVKILNAAVTRDKLATVTRKATVEVFDLTSPYGSTVWPDAATNTAYMGFHVPDDYVSGDISVKINRRSTVSANTAVMNVDVLRERNAAALGTIETALAANYAPGNTNTNTYSYTLAAANFQAGDYIRVHMTRVGADGSDNMAGNVQFAGAWIEYNGKA